jgi:uncharacterized membrane protein
VNGGDEVMLKTLLIATVYFLIGVGICSTCTDKEKRRDPGYVAFVLLFWPLIVAVVAIVTTISLIIAGIRYLFKRDEDEEHHI